MMIVPNDSFPHRLLSRQTWSQRSRCPQLGQLDIFCIFLGEVELRHRESDAHNGIFCSEDADTHGICDTAPGGDHCGDEID
jgi:hypothetical protein